SEKVGPLVALIDRQVALGALGHLPIGGHKTRGAGFGRWTAKPWVNDDVTKARDWTPPEDDKPPAAAASHGSGAFLGRPDSATSWVRTKHHALNSVALTL